MDQKVASRLTCRLQQSPICCLIDEFVPAINIPKIPVFLASKGVRIVCSQDRGKKLTAEWGKRQHQCLDFRRQVAHRICDAVKDALGLELACSSVIEVDVARLKGIE